MSARALTALGIGGLAAIGVYKVAPRVLRYAAYNPSAASLAVGMAAAASRSPYVKQSFKSAAQRMKAPPRPRTPKVQRPLHKKFAAIAVSLRKKGKKMRRRSGR